MGNNPEGAVARIPLGDLSLAEAVEHVEDPSLWQDSMPLILHHFCVGGVDAYWNLRVADHAHMLTWLRARGLE